jgi:hypothetical protein
MAKLNDTQLMILSHAAARDGGSILPLPTGIKVGDYAIDRAVQTLLRHELVAEVAAAPGQEAWRKDDSGHVALVISDAGIAHLSADDAPTAYTSKRSIKKPLGVNAKKRGVQQHRPARSAATPANGKLALLIDLMKRKRGMTIAEAAKTTGWQQHSVRGAISGRIKKRLRLRVTTATVAGRGRIYRIEAR